MSIERVDLELAGDKIAEWIFSTYIEEGLTDKELLDIELATPDTGWVVETTIKAEYAEQFFFIRELIISILDGCIKE